VSKYQGRRFLAIDGEAVSGRYVLLADSLGASVENPEGLTTRECLAFLARKLPRKATWCRVGFGLHYDVNMWVRDLSKEARIGLFHGDMVTFEGYQLEYLANRIFTIREKGEVRAKIYDCLGMFRRPFVNVVTDWLGACPDIIREGKTRRERFAPAEMDFVRAYNAAECEMLTQVLDAVRAYLLALPGGGVDLRGWYGAGAVAASWLRRSGARRLMRRFDERHVGADLLDAFSGAYHGGRVEARMVGTIANVYRYDINSAYAWAISHMGRLSYRWYPAERFLPDLPARMSVWRVTWSLPSGAAIGPFPVRGPTGAITYPLHGTGWYWWPEVKAARVAWGTRRIRVGHGYVCMEGGKPIGSERSDGQAHTLGTVLRTMYQYRHVTGSDAPGGRLLKLSLAAVWGKFAQARSASSTNDDEPGWWFCQPWAGWVTSFVRAAIIAAVAGREDTVVAISTDGIVTTRPLDVTVNDNLGGWKMERFARGTFILPGLFRLERQDGSNTVEKTRGFERANIDWESLLDDLTRKGESTITVRRFIGHVLPDLYGESFEPLRCKFARVPIKIIPAAITRKRLGGQELTGRFDYRRDAIALGVHEGNRDYLSAPMRGHTIHEDAVSATKRDGEMDAIV
jgi:hypothetical protein